MTEYPTIGAVARALETWAPPATAQSYDNVGLQVGDPGRPVEHGLVALDLTPAVLAEAQAVQARLIVTHHPLLFHPLRHLTPSSFVGNLAFRLAEAGIALYSIHTNLDAARGGVSFALADVLGLTDLTFLRTPAETRYKLVTRVPAADAVTLCGALADAGAVVAPPFVGTPEVRLEAGLDRWNLPRVLEALQRAHPSEEAPFDVYPVVQAGGQQGMGVLGRLSEAVPLPAFLDRVAHRLGAGSLRYVGRADAAIARVAVCGGAGSDLVRDALRAGADAFVTADVSYHRFFDVLSNDGLPRMALIDAGHYETEACTEHLLCTWLQQRFPGVTWSRTRSKTSPVQTYIPHR